MNIQQDYARVRWPKPRRRLTFTDLLCAVLLAVVLMTGLQREWSPPAVGHTVSPLEIDNHD